MKKMVLVLVLVTVVLFAAFAAGGREAATAERIIIRAGHVNPPGEPAHEAWELFKKLMEERLGDRVDVRLYPQGQLGNERDLIEQVQLGTIEMTAPAVSPLALYNPELNVLNLPYLFESEQALWSVTDGPIGQRFVDRTLEEGILILDWWSTGVRHIFANKPIRTVRDMAGMKIRVMENPVFVDSFTAIGSQPTPLPYGEVYQSLATGVVDAAENDSSGYRNMNFFEVAPYYSLTAHLIIAKPVLINPEFYNSLPADVRNTLDEVLIEATRYQRELYESNFDSDVEWLKQQGVTVVADVRTEEFQRQLVDVWAKYERDIGADLLADVKATLGIR